MHVVIPVWLAQVDDSVLRRWYDEPTWRRGREYAMRGHVLDVDVIGSTRITATVLGSGRSYRVTIAVLPVPPSDPGLEHTQITSRMLHLSCTCPVGWECKHAVATIIHLRSQVLRGTAERERSSWRSRLQELAGAVDEPSGAAGRQPMAIEYRRVGDDVELKAMKPGQRGRWVKGDLSWDRIAYLREGFLRSHLGVMRAIAECADRARRSESYGYYGYGSRRTAIELSMLGHEIWTLLDQAQDVGIELVPADASRPVLFGGPMLDLVAHVGHADDVDDVVRVGALVLNGEAPVQARTYLGSPAHGVMLDGPDGAAIAVGFRYPLTTQQHAILTSRPVDVPETDLAEFAFGYLPSLARRIPVTVAPDVELPQPEAPRLLVEVTGRAGDSGMPVTTRVAIGYRYGRTEQGPDVTVRGGTTLAIRDREAEQELWPLVEEVLLATDAQASTPPMELTFTGTPALRMLAHLETLRGRDDIVIVHRGDLVTAREVTGAQLGLEVGEVEGRDWFDLAIDMTVDGAPVPLVDLIRALAAGLDHLLLDTGAWISLEGPEMQRLKELLDEAELVVDPTDPSLMRARIRREQVGFYDELAALGVIRREAEAWKESARRLRAGRADEPTDAPAHLQAVLRPYQLDGLHWLDFLQSMGMGGILADDMGLGKTVQTLAMVQLLAERGQMEGPVLVVAPSSVVGGWAEQAARFVPTLPTVAITQTGRKRGNSLLEAIGGASIVVTSYAVARLDVEEFATVGWRLVFLDEAQFVKNSKGQTYKAIRRIGCGSRFALSGTPLENNLMDLWSLLSLTAPGLFPDEPAFRADYAKVIEAGGDDAAEVLGRLLRRIRPVMLRRTKELVAPELPPKQEQVVEVELHPGHRRIYDRRLALERKKVLHLLGDVDRHRVEILASLLRLRQLSLAAVLVDEADVAVPSAKIDVLVEMMADVVAGGHRALVFSSFPSFLRLVEKRFKQEGIASVYLDGRTRKRQERVDEFRAGRADAFLISLKAGGFGLNLTEADYVFVTDPWWNPAAEAQAVDRAHRIGQDKTVMVYRMASKDTIEAKVMALQEHKRELFSQVVDGGDAAIAGALRAEDFRALLE